MEEYFLHWISSAYPKILQLTLKFMVKDNAFLLRSETKQQYEIYISLQCEMYLSSRGFPCSVGKESACNAGDPSSISGLRRSPGEGNGNPLQYSCLENPMDRGAWRTTAHVTRTGHSLAIKPPAALVKYL